MAKILVVDDELSVRLVIQCLLNEKGYETAEASNGLAALKLLETTLFDLIITDLRMPDMDGMNFLREAKKLEASPPVIILTAYTSIETAMEAMKSGVFNYLSKPFKANDLLSAVKNALDAGKSKTSST